MGLIFDRTAQATLAKAQKDFPGPPAARLISSVDVSTLSGECACDFLSWPTCFLILLFLVSHNIDTTPRSRRLRATRHNIDATTRAGENYAASVLAHGPGPHLVLEHGLRGANALRPGGLGGVREWCVGGESCPERDSLIFVTRGCMAATHACSRCDDLVAGYARAQLEKAVGKVLSARDFHEYMLVKAPHR